MKASRTSWLSASIIVVLAICATTNLIAAPIAGPILDPATGHNYYLLQNSNWTDAQSQALSLGGNLATVNDAAESAWISQTFSNYAGVQRNLWIGLNAAGLDGGNLSNYSWADGSSSAYRNWAPNQPDFSDQYVLIIAGGNPDAGKWNNVPNETTSGYEFGPQIPDFGVAEVVPEPSALLLTALGAVTLWPILRRRWVNSCGK
jgi:hypothetical protein